MGSVRVCVCMGSVCVCVCMGSARVCVHSVRQFPPQFRASLLKLIELLSYPLSELDISQLLSGQHKTFGSKLRNMPTHTHRHRDTHTYYHRSGKERLFSPSASWFIPSPVWVCHTIWTRTHSVSQRMVLAVCVSASRPKWLWAFNEVGHASQPSGHEDSPLRQTCQLELKLCRSTGQPLIWGYGYPTVNTANNYLVFGFDIAS